MRPCLTFAPFASVADGLKFTAPDTNDKLNLSAPINIEWELSNEGNPDYTEMDLSWHGEFGSGTSFSYTLTENITGSGRPDFSYKWDPASIVEALESAQNRLSSDKAFFFELRRHPPNSSRAGIEPSDKYAVEGYEMIGSFGNSLSPRWSLGMACVVAVGVLV